MIKRKSGDRKALRAGLNVDETNMHKPCLAQHAAFLVKLNGGDAEWLREKFYFLQAFVNRYKNHQRHKPTGLYYWNDDTAIGVDNDPCTFMRPPKSSGSIYLNCMMYKELLALVYLGQALHMDEMAVEYQRDADELKASIQRHCWDERDGFFYSVDLNLLPYEGKPFSADSNIKLHSGYPRDYDCLIQRIDVWSGFLAMWAGIAWLRNTIAMKRRSTPRSASARCRSWRRCTTSGPQGIRPCGPGRSGASPTTWFSADWRTTASRPMRGTWR
jgi:putative isomerase